MLHFDPDHLVFESPALNIRAPGRIENPWAIWIRVGAKNGHKFIGPTAEYGEYLFSYNDCRECHGEDLKGGVQGQLAPMGWNLDLVKGWTQEEFIATLRTGVDPNGYTLSPNMPWKNIGRMDDDELGAMHEYLIGLE